MIRYWLSFQCIFLDFEIYALGMMPDLQCAPMERTGHPCQTSLLSSAMPILNEETILLENSAHGLSSIYMHSDKVTLSNSLFVCRSISWMCWGDWVDYCPSTLMILDDRICLPLMPANIVFLVTCLLYFCFLLNWELTWGVLLSLTCFAIFYPSLWKSTIQLQDFLLTG